MLQMLQIFVEAGMRASAHTQLFCRIFSYKPTATDATGTSDLTENFCHCWCSCQILILFSAAVVCFDQRPCIAAQNKFLVGENTQQGQWFKNSSFLKPQVFKIFSLAYR